MEYLNMSGSICSILSLFISLYTLKQVVTLKVRLSGNANASNQTVKGKGNKVAGRDIK